MSKPKPSFTFVGNGEVLTKLLTKAAGLENQRVRKLVCTLETGKLITFEAEFIGTEEQIGEAVQAVDVTMLTQCVRESIPGRVHQDEITTTQIP